MEEEHLEISRRQDEAEEGMGDDDDEGEEEEDGDFSFIVVQGADVMRGQDHEEVSACLLCVRKIASHTEVVPGPVSLIERSDKVLYIDRYPLVLQLYIFAAWAD